MKGFVKHALIFIFLMIVVTSLMGTKTTSNLQSSSINSAISDIEEDIGSSNIIDDGVIKEEEGQVQGGNFFARLGIRIGDFVVFIVGKILEVLSFVIVKFM